MGALLEDARLGIRMLARSPGFTLAAALTLAIGIGGTSAIFSAIDAAVLTPPPFREPDRLVLIWNTSSEQGVGALPLTAPDFADYREGSATLEDAALTSLTSLNVAGDGEAERVIGARASHRLFPVLGVAPALGRAFTPAEDRAGGDRVVVLSDGLWRRRYGSDPGVLGRTLRLDGQPHSIVGVMPPGFLFPPSFGLDGGATSTHPDLWVPLALSADEGRDRSLHTFVAIARLRAGATLAQAQSDLSRLAVVLQRAHPDTNEGFSTSVSLVAEQLGRSARPPLLVLLCAVAFVLLIGCANVASLLLARMATRQRELVLRSALGAGRFRLVRQLLVECLVLAAPSAALGLTFAYAGTRALALLADPIVPGVARAGLDLRALVFTAVLSLLAALVYGLAPALVASAPDLATALKETGSSVAGGGRGARARKALVVLETALALTLLVGAGAAAKGLARLQRNQPGFDAAGVLTARLNLSAASYPGAAEKASFTRELLTRVSALPGVTAAGTVDVLPLSGRDYYWSFTIEGRPPVNPADLPLANFRTASPGFLAGLGIPLRAGRDFDDRDSATSPRVAIVNETLAARHFPGESAIGKRLSFTDPPAPPIWHEIVGVVADIKQSGLDGAAIPDVYVAQFQAPRPNTTLVLRTEGPPAGLAGAIRSEVGRLDRDQAVFDVKPMSAYLEESTARPRLLARLLACFAGVALLLAAVGTYGVVSHSVGQRTRELAIRSALGATPGSIVGAVLRHVLALALLGISLGAVAGLCLTRLLSRLLYGVDAWDVPLLLGAAAVLALVSLAAGLVPAGRATRADPIALLRAE